jgi:hypothetical protein
MPGVVVPGVPGVVVRPDPPLGACAATGPARIRLVIMIANDVFQVMRSLL